MESNEKLPQSTHTLFGQTSCICIYMAISVPFPIPIAPLANRRNL